MSEIITHGLVPVVGMGVVSRATDTMFSTKGKRKTTKRKTSRRSAPKSARTRKFDGKVYHLANTHNTKKIAEKDAEYFRKAGHSARVVHADGKWKVYVR